MMKKLFLISGLNLLLCATYAQVGIGNVSPSANSILDLTNTNNRGLLLPSTSSYPTGPPGLLFYNISDNVVYYNEGGSYNGLSPWRYKFGLGVVTSENTYFNKSGNVGIGLSNPQKKLHVKDNGEALVIEGTNHSYLGLYNTGYASGMGAAFGFLSNASTTLVISNDILNGNIEINGLGSGTLSIAAATNVTEGDLTVEDGDVDAANGKIKEEGNALLPTGVVVMFSGTTAPPGWVLCDGSAASNAAGAPNLKGRFIVGYDPSDADYNAIGDVGGAKNHDHSLPNHRHTMNHNHTSFDVTVSPGGARGCAGVQNGSSEYMDNNATATVGIDVPNYAGSTGDTNFTSNTSNGRPPFYTLAYIYKL